MAKSLIVVGVLGIGALCGLYLYQPSGRDAVNGHLCAEEYSRAKSRIDSLRIDGRPPTGNLGQGEMQNPRLTCGELRRLGKVK